ncbi:hypothetical protein LTR29_012455 [Friedmanniomyces endolithicus]|nr:hypothetical protein LTR29_012455 [Friedmanniomyces endolithicus]
MSLKVLLPSTTAKVVFKQTPRYTTQTALRFRAPVLRSTFTTSPRIKMDAAEAKFKESVPEKDHWKTKAPYKVHDPQDHFDVKYEASCHCGKAQFQLSRDEPLDSKLCHCTTCQTQHAAPFQWAAIFHKDDINFTHGHHDLEWYDPTSKSIEHQLPCKVRCSFCHSPIMDEGRNMILLFPSLVHLKTDEAKAKFKPRLHMFYEQRVMDIPDGLPKWSGINDDSDLIEDSPPEEVKENERKREQKRKEKFAKGENK